MNYKYIKSLKTRCESKEEFKEILLTAEKDLKFNFFVLNKRVTTKYFLRVLNIVEIMYRRELWT